jgi:hypothetical protein
MGYRQEERKTGVEGITLTARLCLLWERNDEMSDGWGRGEREEVASNGMSFAFQVGGRR